MMMLAQRTIVVLRWTGTNLRPCCLTNNSCSTYYSTSSFRCMAAVLTIGIPRETYSPWERRAPLTPWQVQKLLADHKDDLAIMVQPSARRIFVDQDYIDAGATLLQDLSSADVILGVKRPTTVHSGLTYFFFSHTIKGQPSNMGLLRECLQRNVQLFDYERITRPCDERPQRLVSFGRFAGIAGILDSFHTLGRRLLCSQDSRGGGASTPFLSFPPAIMHDSLDDAKEQVLRLSARIAGEGFIHHEPLVFAVTGLGGGVHNGAMEILQMLPHDVVHVDDLPRLFHPVTGLPASIATATTQYKIYIVPVSLNDAFQRIDGQDFARNDFQQRPAEYRSLFAKRVAPYSHVIINCAYWDARFPRLLKKRQIKRLHEDGNQRLQLVVDISCDIHGSIEFLERTTTTDNPTFQYNPIIGCEINEESGHEITVIGVDNLPAELPKESSAHFGEALIGVVKELVQAKKQQSRDIAGIDTALLPPGLSDACITANGALEPGFQYLRTLMDHGSEDQKDAQEKSMTVSLEGHLFDSSLINQVLDVIEQYGTGLEFKECIFPPQSGRETMKSNIVLKIKAGSNELLDQIEQKICSLVDLIETADASVVRFDQQEKEPVQNPRRNSVVESLKKDKRVLVLGTGRVSKSFVDYLGRFTDASITVASDKEDEARVTASASKKAKPMVLDVMKDFSRLSALIEEADVVVSLLPANMHPPVALESILLGTHLVTASYESKEMRSMGERARDANIILLNEVGLDPGLDHMSAMKIIDSITTRGGKVTSFSSVCGGLPEPNANDNPLKYKFSWNPLGVISASQNEARYLLDGNVVEIKGNQLLQSAMPFTDAWNDLDLECLPNRNSLKYEDIYQIRGVDSIFRGTLRYRGFSKLMNTFQKLGLFEDSKTQSKTWRDLLDELRASRGGFTDVSDFVQACTEDDEDSEEEAMLALKWLDVLGDEPLRASTIVDAFCKAMQKKLVYRNGEHDMILMHNKIVAVMNNGMEERHSSSLCIFGDDYMSAMSKTVGYTAAASTKLILDGGLNDKRGLLLPTDSAIYLPVLKQLESVGIVFNEIVDEIHDSQRKSKPNLRKGSKHIV